MRFGDSTVAKTDLGAFRLLPNGGEAYVVAEAMKLGFSNGHQDWSNLGQGQPEIGEMIGAPPRLSSVKIEAEDLEYGPVEGTQELRERIAQHYNRLFRKGKASQYTADHVCVASGGQLAITRTLVGLGSVKIGYQLPDYTAYEGMLGPHLDRLTAVPIRAREEDGFMVRPQQLEQAVLENGLEAYLVSNPCNPTGTVLQGGELQAVCDMARRRDVTLILDEFYSHYIYTPDGEAGAGPVSGAEFVDDVDRDPVMLIDGLTKNYRYPGWRLGWVLGPKPMIETLKCAASSVDGGPSRLVQRAALEILEPERADQETMAMRAEFTGKRNMMVDRLKEMGVTFAREPESTFYCWGNLGGLKPPFNDAQVFFRRALERKVMTVPGEFFDVNPGKRRTRPTLYGSWMRFSFGPPRANLAMGLERLEVMLRGDDSL